MDCRVDANDIVIPNVESLAKYADVLQAKRFCRSTAPVQFNFWVSPVSQQCYCCAVGDQCVCPQNRIVSHSGHCICPSGTFLESGNCVDSCFKIRDDRNGFVCPWSDPDKSELSLGDDCGIKVPHADDNYVAAKRINQGDATKEGPVVSVTATSQRGNFDPIQAKSTWLDNESTPGVLEGQVKLTKFGVYELAMDASDYKATTSCSGCLAVVDNYPPTAKQKCQTAAPATTTDFSSEALEAAISTESAFTAFYAPTNIVNNGDYDESTGDNERCDTKSNRLKDFFSDYTDLESIDTVCFDNDYVADLMNALPAASTLSTKSERDLKALSCKRCCKKSY